MTLLILASQSRYRAQQLESLGLKFVQVATNIDEAQKAHETPYEMALRLSLAKARAYQSAPDKRKGPSLVIASDQTAELNGKLYGKPGSKAAAIKQLLEFSAKRVVFNTGICVSNGERELNDVCKTEVTFLSLSRRQVETYIERDNPIDCAGSFKSEGLGITLFESITSNDPSALVGLPLIALTRLLRKFGFDPLTDTSKPINRPPS